MNQFKEHKNFMEVFINSKRYGNISFIIDKSSWNKIKKYNWSLTPSKTVGTKFYVQNRELGLLHRYLMDYPDGKCVDHINRNTLDNRIINLRACSSSENNCNRKGYGRCKYKYLSISIRYDRQKPRLLYIVKFPSCKAAQRSSRNEAYAYYIECLLDIGKVLT